MAAEEHQSRRVQNAPLVGQRRRVARASLSKPVVMVMMPRRMYQGPRRQRSTPEGRQATITIQSWPAASRGCGCALPYWVFSDDHRL